jgi:hypothetical protein
MYAALIEAKRTVLGKMNDILKPVATAVAASGVRDSIN